VPADLLSELTSREREVLAEIATGKSNAAIADVPVLTKRAVEKHVNSIFANLDLPDSEGTSRRVKATLLFLAEEHEDRARGEDEGGPGASGSGAPGMVVGDSARVAVSGSCG